MVRALNDPMKLSGLFHGCLGRSTCLWDLGSRATWSLRTNSIWTFSVTWCSGTYFLMGLILMLLPSEIFRSISQMDIVFPPALNTLAKVLAVAGAVGLLLMSGRANKNPVLRLALGAYDIYNITGWLSDVLSYSRLLALGLATGVIASVVNRWGACWERAFSECWCSSLYSSWDTP